MYEPGCRRKKGDLVLLSFDHDRSSIWIGGGGSIANRGMQRYTVYVMNSDNYPKTSHQIYEFILARYIDVDISLVYI